VLANALGKPEHGSYAGRWRPTDVPGAARGNVFAQRAGFTNLLLGLASPEGQEPSGQSAMWVFGYGSLMWDRWGEAKGCIRSTKAELRGYRRVFNKASVRNWGTEKFPCPTLNLVQSESSWCRGIAFEFHDSRAREIKQYLIEREGKGFTLRELPAQLDQGDQITAIVPIYGGGNLIHEASVTDVVNMVLQAKGRDGSCVRYVKSIAEALRGLEIDDPAVIELWHALSQSGREPRMP